MIGRRRGSLVGAAVAVVVLALAPGCPGRRPPALVPTPSGGDVGLYRARTVDADGRTRRFRLWLWAAAPDRLHAEVLTPVGGTVLILDAGNDRVAASFVRDREAYVGSDDDGALARLLDVDVSVADLVAALLDGRIPAGDAALERTPESRGLPERLVLRHGGRSLDLELRRRGALPEDAPRPGTGEPPDGYARRPLRDLAARDLSELDGDPP